MNDPAPQRPEPSTLNALRRLFRRESIRLLIATSAPEALGRLEQTPVDLVITDERTPDMDGGTLLEHVRTRRPNLPCLKLTGYAGASHHHRSGPSIVDLAIAKPWDDEELKRIVRERLGLSPAAAASGQHELIPEPNPEPQPY